MPLAHIAGGDTTEGAFDESIRHAITKMAHVHFATNAHRPSGCASSARTRRRCTSSAAPGSTTCGAGRCSTAPALEAALGAPLGARNLLVTFHPVTLEPGAGVAQLDELLDALDGVGAETTIWFTRPNADTGGRAIAARLDAWAASRPSRVRVFASLGQLRYLSLMAQVDAVVGNSSSGLYEAPSFGIPTVDIGERQRGRLAAASVIHCEPTRAAIAAAIDRALAPAARDRRRTRTATATARGRIVDVLRRARRAPRAAAEALPLGSGRRHD